MNCVWSSFACLALRCYGAGDARLNRDRIRLEVSSRLITAKQVDLHKRYVFLVEGLLALFSVSIFAP